MNNRWHKAICMFLSLIFVLSGALQAAVATTAVDVDEEPQTSHRHLIVEVIKSPCGKSEKLERIVMGHDCCDDTDCQTDCSLCLYGLVEDGIEFARLPPVAVRGQSEQYLSVTLWPPTRPPIT